MVAYVQYSSSWAVYIAVTCTYLLDTIFSHFCITLWNDGLKSFYPVQALTFCQWLSCCNTKIQCYDVKTETSGASRPRQCLSLGSYSQLLTAQNWIRFRGSTFGICSGENGTSTDLLQCHSCFPLCAFQQLVEPVRIICT